jgi:phosphopantetheinyl transferase
MSSASITKRIMLVDDALPDEAVADLSWLGDQEQRELERFSEPRRRRQWLAGRRLAKELVAGVVKVPRPAMLQIVGRDERGLAVRPRILADRQELAWSLSIAHSERFVFVAVADSRAGSLGVDVAAARLPSTDGFCRLWFTARERQWIEHDRDRRCAMLWAAKEAVYKAANAGQSWNPREVSLTPIGSAGFECSYRGRVLSGMTLQLDERDAHWFAVAWLAKGAASRVETASTERSSLSTSRARSRDKSTRFTHFGVRDRHVRQ